MKYGTLRFRAQPDVNSLSGFTEALALATGGELSDDQLAELNRVPDRSIAAGLTESQEDQPRGEDGRFEQPAAEPAAEEDDQGAAPAAAAAPAEEEPKTYEDGYARALGEMSERLGAERAKREDLEARLARLEEPEQSSEPEFFIPTQDDIEELEDQLSSLGGPAFMTQIGTQAPEKIDAALAVWKAQGDPNAWIYEASVNRIIAQNTPKDEPAAPAQDPVVQRLVQRERVAELFNSFASELGQEEATRIFPHLEAALNDAGSLTREAIGVALASGDEKRQKLAFNELVGLAKTKAASTVATTQRKEAVTQAKSAARVATGSQRVATPGQSTLPGSKEEFEKLSAEDRRAAATLLVAKQFDKTNTTSVQDGLTGL